MCRTTPLIRIAGSGRGRIAGRMLQMVEVKRGAALAVPMALLVGTERCRADAPRTKVDGDGHIDTNER